MAVTRSLQVLVWLVVVGASGCGARTPHEEHGERAGACSSDAECGPGQACCYPCGIEGCQNVCMSVDPARGCPEIP
ncbi:MAG: hypothetical protein U0353_15780 [Sandaracinus sp.]